MNEPEAVEDRLLAHVDSILDGASYRKRDREDLAEELYGHLWERWQDAISSGLDEETAADDAIRSFGAPDRLGREVTLAYHSRLYASTIGVLVPTVTAPKDKPRGYWIIYLVLFTSMYATGMAQGLVLMTWTPVRAGIGLPGAVMAWVASSLVLSAYTRRQHWALDFARLEAALLLLWAGFLLLTDAQIRPVFVGSAGGMGLAVITMSQPLRLRPLSSWRDLRLRALSSWMNERPVPRRLLVGLAAMLILGPALPLAALGVADPTQIGPADLHVSLLVACARNDSGDVASVDVTASFVFDRTDMWPNGLEPDLTGRGPTDEIALTIEGAQPAGVPMAALRMTRVPSGRDATNGSPLTIDDAGEPDGGALWDLPGSMRFQAGHSYEVTWNYAVDTPASGLRDLSRVIFGYDHLERFYLQATAGCGQAAIGQTVPRLYVAGP